MTQETATATATAETNSTRLDQLREQHKNATAAVREQEKALAGLVKAIGSEDAARKIAAYGMIETAHTEAVEKADKLARSIESEEKAAATQSYMQPIIDAVGTVTVKDAKALPASVHVVEIEVLVNKASEALNRAQSQFDAYTAIAAAVGTVSIPDDVIGDLRPLRIKPTGETTLVVEVGTRSGPTGPRGSRTAYKITAAGEGFESLAGKLVGKGGDFANWRAVVEASDPTEFARLEAKRKEGSNWSARVMAERRFKLTTEEVADNETAA